MKSFAVVALASVALAAPNCDISTIDKCLKKALPYSNRTSLGVTPEEIEKECKCDREAIACLLDYAESGCVKGDTELALRITIRGAAEESALRCQKGTARNADYLKYVSCVNKAGPKLNKCFRDTTSYIETAGRGGVGTGLPQGCCALGRLSTCIGGAAAAECGADAEMYVKNVFTGILGNFLDKSCGAYQAMSEKCQSIEILKTEGEPKFFTPVGAFFDIVKNEM
ncbi:uncharacterized protein LOC100906062 [Galendromus occidentalis]|uniref:Uncharacterized protein LOC100906062 n=1 Tax=Galendromus occidentalis TaxID=34638 RepID=A0AAJ6VXS4_9ACAR|nr:uncharacterized protein LOC100906062 [Galendromus occidentalis]